jgi:hypothetical protein
MQERSIMVGDFGDGPRKDNGHNDGGDAENDNNGAPTGNILDELKRNDVDEEVRKPPKNNGQGGNIYSDSSDA